MPWWSACPYGIQRRWLKDWKTAESWPDKTDRFYCPFQTGSDNLSDSWLPIWYGMWKSQRRSIPVKRHQLCGMWSQRKEESGTDILLWKRDEGVCQLPEWWPYTINGTSVFWRKGTGCRCSGCFPVYGWLSGKYIFLRQSCPYAGWWYTWSRL